MGCTEKSWTFLRSKHNFSSSFSLKYIFITNILKFSTCFSVTNFITTNTLSSPKQFCYSKILLWKGKLNNPSIWERLPSNTHTTDPQMVGVERMGEDRRRKQREMVRNIDSSATRVNVSMHVNWMIYWTAYRQENISHELIICQYLQCTPPFHWGAANNSAGSSHTSHTGNLSNSADSWCTGGMTHFHMAPSIQRWTP